MRTKILKCPCKKAEGIEFEDHVIHVITSRPQEVDKKIIIISFSFMINYVVKGQHHNTTVLGNKLLLKNGKNELYCYCSRTHTTSRLYSLLVHVEK